MSRAKQFDIKFRAPSEHIMISIVLFLSQRQKVSIETFTKLVQTTDRLQLVYLLPKYRLFQSQFSLKMTNLLQIQNHQLKQKLLKPKKNRQHI